MSEDRTLEPSPRRRQQARQQGQVARSAELSAAVVLLVAVAALGLWGGALMESLLALGRASWLEATFALAISQPTEAFVRLERRVWEVLGPLAAVVAGVAVAGVAAHQVQVRGLWVPGLVAPRFERLWSRGAGHGPGADLGARGGRGLWSVVRTVVIVAVAAGGIWSHMPRVMQLGQLDAPALARASGDVLRNLAGTLALTLLALGVLDFLMQHRRVEAQLRLTPEEQREELRASEGDPILRSRHRQVATAWRSDPAPMLAGASLVLTGPGGLTVVLAGGPPPRRITIRHVARGAPGSRLRRDAEPAGLVPIEAPEIAQTLARLRSSEATLPAETLAELTAIWPAVD